MQLDCHCRWIVEKLVFKNGNSFFLFCLIEVFDIVNESRDKRKIVCRAHNETDGSTVRIDKIRLLKSNLDDIFQHDTSGQ